MSVSHSAQRRSMHFVILESRRGYHTYTKLREVSTVSTVVESGCGTYVSIVNNSKGATECFHR